MKNKEQQEYLDHLRHSCAHLLAAAVKELYPEAKLTIGPAIENGFYYDIEFPVAVSDEDLPRIEAKMHELVKNWQGFEREEVSAQEALARYADNPYKQELINEFAEEGKTLSIYHSGEFADLCRGGHVENPAEELKYFTLLSLAGAYWRGDEKNPMLTRVYGTAFPSQEELDAHLQMLEEARKRDHRRLGKELDLFTFSELVGPGLPLWTPKGTLMRNILDDFVWSLRKKHDFQKVTIPHITKKDLYETSGHWDKFKDELFRINTREGHEFALKPMNCPHHTQIFAHLPRSYRDMPQRYCESTTCYRDEQTGELHGLSRVRGFTQDDSHVFCRYSQIEQEVMIPWQIIHEFYAALGMNLRIRFSLHDPDNMQNYLGTPEIWEDLVSKMRSILDKQNVEYEEAVGEAAFYGPKFDFLIDDAIGREWQVATIQLDFNQPERFNLFCINEQGEEERIAMIHVAVMGSIERFFSIFIEHFAGAFPLWLAPVQVAVVPIGEEQYEYAQQVARQLREQEIRVEIRAEAETMQNRIRKAEQEKVPYMLIVGGREAEAGTVSVRGRGQKNLGTLSIEEFEQKMLEEVEKKTV